MQLSYVWQQWQGFLVVLRVVAHYRGSVMLLCFSGLQLLGEALSWYCWGGSPLRWALCRAQLHQAQMQSKLLLNLPADVCYLVVGSTPSSQLVRALCKLPAPVLGSAGTPEIAQTLWLASGIACSGLEAQGALIAACWYMLGAFC